MPKYRPLSHSQRFTLAYALGRLLEHTRHRVRDGVRSPHTLRMQRWHVGWMIRLALPLPLAEQLHAKQLGEVAIHRLTPPILITLIEYWRAAGGAGGGELGLPSVAKRKSTLGRALRLAVGRGELLVAPQMPEIGLPPLRPRLRILRTHGELQRLLGALPERRAEYVAVSVWTCQRPGDVGRMRWADVDLRSRAPSMIVRSTKTRKPHGIRCKVPPPLVQTLLNRHARLEAATGMPPAASDLLVDPWPGASQRLPVVCARLGLPPLTPMDLRHTGFSWMVRRLGITRAAQEWGGWSDFAMLSRYYAHALPAGLEQAADELASIVDDDDRRDA